MLIGVADVPHGRQQMAIGFEDKRAQIGDSGVSGITNHSRKWWPRLLSCSSEPFTIIPSK